MKHIIEVERYREHSKNRYLWRFVTKKRLRVERGTTLHGGITLYEIVDTLSGFDSREDAIAAAKEQLNNGINATAGRSIKNLTELS